MRRRKRKKGERKKNMIIERWLARTFLFSSSLRSSKSVLRVGTERKKTRKRERRKSKREREKKKYISVDTSSSYIYR